MIRQKRCGTCRETKPVTDFNIARGANDGLQYVCRACQSMAAKDRYEANIEKWSRINPHTGEPYEGES